MKRGLVLIASCCIALGSAAAAMAESVNRHPITLHSERITLPQTHREFPGGKDAKLANDYCRICHSADFVYVQPPLSKKDWHAEVVKMQKVYKCPLPDKDVDALVAYLYSQNGKK